MADYRQLEVWRLAHAFALSVYGLTRSFPDDERFGLVSQLRRGSASIAANLAEGSSRKSDRDFARFATMAIASASEVEYHLLLARDIGYVDRDEWHELTRRVSQIRAMLQGLRATLLRSGGR